MKTETSPPLNNPFKSPGVPSMSDATASPQGNLETAHNPFAAPEHLQLGDTMRDRSIHPVIIFGSNAAGKSVLLASLLTYGQEVTNESPHLDITFGEPLFDSGINTGRKLNALALSFYETKVYRWQRREVLPGTQGDAFFVPVDVELTSREATQTLQKFAFLDWEGEKLTPISSQADPVMSSSDTELRSRKRIMDQMASSLLAHFPRPISVLFLLPMEKDNATTERHCQTIASMIERYKEHRGGLARNDHCLFLLNQWDKAYNVGSENFVAPSEDLLEDLLSGTYRSPAWSKFLGLPGNLVKMQHSSGVHDNDGVRISYESPHKEQLLRYPKTLWNWLLTNASGNGNAVYPDVVPAQPLPELPPPPSAAPAPEPTAIRRAMYWLNRL